MWKDTTQKYASVGDQHESGERLGPFLNVESIEREAWSPTRIWALWYDKVEKGYAV